MNAFRAAAISFAALELIGSSACCCKPSTGARINTLQAENTRLRFQIDATTRSNLASREYAEELRTGTTKEPLFEMLYAAPDLVTLAAQTVPYRIDAREFNSDVSGWVVIDQIYGFIFAPGNRVICKLRFHGEGIEYHGNVPAAYQSTVEEFKAGIATGAIADVESVLSISGGMLRVFAQTTDVKMLKNSKGIFESNLRDQMNQNALVNPIPFDVRIVGKPATVKRVVVTASHVAVGYTVH